MGPDERLPEPLIDALIAEPDLSADEVGDNEPYDGALAGDTIDAIATSRGLANALIEIRQDLIAERREAHAWAARLARLLRPIVADRKSARAGGLGHSDEEESAWPGKTLGRNLTRGDVRGDPSSPAQRARSRIGMAKTNETTTSGTSEVNAGHLRAFVERIERLEEEKKALSGDIKDVYGEAKANGFDVKIMRKIVSIRKQDRDSRIEEETILDLYLAALGMN